jgi:hypothetical protein
VTREKLNLRLFGRDSSIELNTKKLENSPRFLSVTYTASSDKRFRSYRILRIGKLLKTELHSTTIGSTKFWQLSKTETPGLPNAIPLGNSLHFPMAHFMTPNGQQVTSYGYQNMAGLLTRGNLNKLDLSEQIKILVKFHHDLPRNFAYKKYR